MFVGDAVEQHRGVLRLSYPMEHGHVVNWSDMESVWEHLFNQLEVPSKEVCVPLPPLFLSTVPCTSNPLKTTTVESSV